MDWYQHTSRIDIQDHDVGQSTTEPPLQALMTTIYVETVSGIRRPTLLTPASGYAVLQLCEQLRDVGPVRLEFLQQLRSFERRCEVPGFDLVGHQRQEDVAIVGVPGERRCRQRCRSNGSAGRPTQAARL